ncbi:TetR/AcrR family transcriptional regulator [Polymorphospora rubra]|uniref:TetR family transcriptional regulator n=1 Tax=Polymorphospora rubra TaxID=338584 RepID=A0A810N122_9ACTN|nr:TetR/AcrR family transcriptional regulator [Polymorphospora rubra]BCJ67291.1 TetR family transcriptional regulator [Polymorphospora rubra]
MAKKSNKETTSERVLRVATELFAEKGYDATGVQELSESTGLGRGALYYHIKNKQQLLLSIALRLLENANREARRILASGGSAEDRLHRMAEHLLMDLSTNRSAWITSMRDWQALDEPHRSHVRHLRDEYEQYWQALFDEGAEAGLFRPVHAMQRRAIVGMFTSSYRWIEPAGSLSPKQISELYVSLFLDGLRVRKGD